MIFSINNKKRNLVKSKKAARKLRFQAAPIGGCFAEYPQGAPSGECFAGQSCVTEQPVGHRTKAENTRPFCITR